MSSPPNKILVVLGATGNQGGAVVRYFAKHEPNAFQLRGITRNPDSKSSQALKDLGVEMVKADAGDTSSLKSAFAGATHIYANTDSNHHIFDAANDSSLLGPGQTPITYATSIELQQGRNVIETAASTSTLERIVWSSTASPKKWTKGKYDKVGMFDVKEEILDLFWANPVLKEKLSVLFIGFYVMNALNLPKFYCPQKQSDGTYELALPIAPDSQQPMADVEGDVGSWTAALFKDAPGTKLLGQSEKMSWSQWTETWSSINGVEGRFRKCGPEEFIDRVAPLGEPYTQEFQFVEEQGLTGGIPGMVLPEDLRKRGIELRTTPVRETMSQVDWSSVL